MPQSSREKKKQTDNKRPSVWVSEEENAGATTYSLAGQRGKLPKGRGHAGKRGRGSCFLSPVETQWEGRKEKKIKSAAMFPSTYKRKRACTNKHENVPGRGGDTVKPFQE